MGLRRRASDDRISAKSIARKASISDLRPGHVGDLRGAYFNDEYGVDVMVMKELPEDPIIFTMAHELKHHLVDSSLEIRSQWKFEEANPIEVGAEVFASELIYP